MSITNCPICNTLINPVEEPITPKGGHLTPDVMMTINCHRCGRFFIAKEAIETIPKNVPPRQRFIMSLSIKNMEKSSPPLIWQETIAQLLAIKDKSPLDKLDLLLLHIYKEAEKLLSVFMGVQLDLTKNLQQGHPHDAPSPSSAGYAIMDACWADSLPELYAMIKRLIDQKYLACTKINSLWPVELTTKGLERVATLLRDKGEGKQCFVAMWFDETMNNVLNESIKLGIEDAGYDAFRIDGKEHANKIDDEIIMEIRRSRFLVADFTGQRGGVYFEVGFAMGLGLPVIWTCRDDEVEKLHFDIRQYNCLKWSSDDLPKFRKSLHKRIESILGHGPQ